MDSIKSNQLSNKLDLTSSALLPAALPWGHDPETSKWFLYERSSRLRRDPYQVHSILKLVSNRIQTEYGIEPSSDWAYNPLPYCKGQEWTTRRAYLDCLHNARIPGNLAKWHGILCEYNWNGGKTIEILAIISLQLRSGLGVWKSSGLHGVVQEF